MAVRVKFLGKFQYRKPRSHPEIPFPRNFSVEAPKITQYFAIFQLSLFGLFCRFSSIAKNNNIVVEA